MSDLGGTAGVPERSKGPDLSSGGKAFVGSNPTPCTSYSLSAVFDPHHGAPKVAIESHNLDFRQGYRRGKGRFWLQYPIKNPLRDGLL